LQLDIEKEYIKWYNTTTLKGSSL